MGEMMPSAAAAVSDRCAQMRQLWEELTSAARLRSVSPLYPSQLNRLFLFFFDNTKLSVG